MTEEGSIDVETVSPVWSLGWQWPWGILLAAMLGGNFLFAADQLLLGTAALVGGPGVTAAGVRAVNRQSADALADGARSVRRAVAAQLEQEDRSTVHSLAVGADSAYGLDHSKRYDLTVVTLGETGLTIHHDATVDLLDTTWTVAEQAERIPYEQVTAVSAEDRALRLELVDGETKSLASGRRPVELSAALERRLD